MELFVLATVALVVAVSPFVFLILHLLARDRLKQLERAVGALRNRVEQLETGGGAWPAPHEQSRAAPAPAAATAPPTSAAASPAGPAATAVAPATAPPMTPPSPASTTAAAPAATKTPAAPRAAAAARRTSAEWEQLIGASWLNKIGAVATVVGIAFALGYSMRYLGPAGRVTVALAMSVAMLGAGVVLERSARYRLFARGLIGGGWAGLYFTTFAMHGLDAARIVESPIVGTVLLLAVAASMVIHALRYRSETITGLAYFIAFGTLAIVPVTRYALFSSILAAASLLYVATRFKWERVMVAGVVFTYGAYLLRGGAPDVRPEDWLFGQGLLFAYWILFEAFDLQRLRWRTRQGLAETMFPLNAAGFIGVSSLGWSALHADTLWLFFALGATLFAADAALRALWAPRADLAADGSPGRLRGGSYEASLVASAFLLVLSIERGFDGWRENIAWLLAAQLFVLGGLALRNAFVRHLGSAVLVVPVLAVIFDDLPSAASFVAIGHTWLRSTPLALATAATLYGNRALVRMAQGARVGGLEHAYNWAGTFLLVAVLTAEAPDVWIAPAWLALAVVLLAISTRRGASELFVQGYLLAVLSWLLMALGNVPTNETVLGWPARWTTALPLIAALYAISMGRRAPATRGEAGPSGEVQAAASAAVGSAGRHGIEALAEWLDRGAAATAFFAATGLLWWFLLFEVSGSWLTVAWGVQGAALLAAGFTLRVRVVRLTGLALIGVCVGKLFVYDISELDVIFRIFSFIILGVLSLVVSFVYTRYRSAQPRRP